MNAEKKSTKNFLVKILVGMVVLFAVTVGGLWLAGGGEQEHKADIQIAATAELVFSYLSEGDKIMQWMDGITEIRPVTEGGHKVGAKAVVVIEEQGRRYELNDEVLRTQPGELLEVKLTSPMFEVISTYELSADGEQTQVQHTFRARYSGAARIFAPIMSGAVQEQLDKDLFALKNLLESL